ncbi:MAG: RNA polymerase sigma factor [Pirellulales bacterium]|nr:RNA polymerase sigma factor [Pirellulales bacterium]
MQSPDPARQVLRPDDRQHVELLEGAFARYQPELLGMLFYVVGNREDARDALQEAFVKCWRRRDRLAQVENLRAWIFRIALNTGRDLRATAWRRRSRPLSDEASTLASGDRQPGAEVEQQEQLRRIRQALAELRHEEQEVFLLRQNGQMTYEEIARSINIPVGTVKTRMRLALNKLRQVLQPDGEVARETT